MTTIELYHIYDRAVARIKKNDRDKYHYDVTPSSCQRLAMHVFKHRKKFQVWPYVTGLVGWTADSNEEATE